MGHKHVRFINACEKFLKKENGVETTNGLLSKVTNYKERTIWIPSISNQLAQLLTRDKRFKQVDIAKVPDNLLKTLLMMSYFICNGMPRMPCALCPNENINVLMNYSRRQNRYLNTCRNYLKGRCTRPIHELNLTSSTTGKDAEISTNFNNVISEYCAIQKGGK